MADVSLDIIHFKSRSEKAYSRIGNFNVIQQMSFLSLCLSSHNSMTVRAIITKFSVVTNGIPEHVLSFEFLKISKPFKFLAKGPFILIK